LEWAAVKKVPAVNWRMEAKAAKETKKD